jgi:2-keto-4-pentenoate hydratase
MSGSLGGGPLADPRLARGMAAQMELRRIALAAGARPIGWKVGFGSAAGLAKLGISAPLVGFLLERAVVASGGTVSLAAFAMPVAEPEIAVEIGTDLPGGSDEAAAAAAIAALGPAFELADFAPSDDPEAILSGNIFQRHVVFGPRLARPDGATAGLVSTVRRNGIPVPAPADVTANTGSLPMIVRHVADTLAALGETLRAGDVIIAGSITAPLMLTAEDRLLEHVLDPVGEVSVRFS